MRTVNRQVVLKARPVGIPQSEHFEIVERPLPKASDGQFVARNLYLAVEPAMRGWVNAVGNYSNPVGIGEVMRSFAVAEVVDSNHPSYQIGDRVVGMFGWQDYAVSNGSNVVHKVDREFNLPISTTLGVLGLNGVTAYFALLDIGMPKPGETVVVSTAAGAVGSCVGQIAKLKGCRTVGIAGGPQKVALCRNAFNFDAAIDYKSGADLPAALSSACPDGIDVYFDNTAGAISDAVLPQINVKARVVICGTASVATWEPPPVGPRVERTLLVKRARMEGFLFFDYKDRYAEAIDQLYRWVIDGLISYREEISEGIETAPYAIASLYRGDNLGRRLIRLTAD